MVRNSTIALLQTALFTLPLAAATTKPALPPARAGRWI